MSNSGGMKLVFIGDSLIDAYRVEEHACPSRRLGMGWVFLVMADLMVRFPGRPLDPVNRGIPGNRLRDVAVRWERDCLAHMPDVVTLGVGANDTRRVLKDGEGDSVEVFEAGLLGLLERGRAAMPRTRFFVMEPFLVPTGQATPAHMADIEARAGAARRSTRAAGACFVELGAPFREKLLLAPAPFWAYDGIHPTPAGHRLIADAWLSALASEIPELGLPEERTAGHA
jgi:acyl-CoA thioesterase-1